jgi:hypothetical protein
MANKQLEDLWKARAALLDDAACRTDAAIERMKEFIAAKMPEMQAAAERAIEAREEKRWEAMGDARTCLNMAFENGAKLDEVMKMVLDVYGAADREDGGE